MKEKALVLGAGLQGASCALALRSAGYYVADTGLSASMTRFLNVLLWVIPLLKRWFRRLLPLALRNRIRRHTTEHVAPLAVPGNVEVCSEEL